MALVDEEDRSDWGHSKTSLEKLDEFWEDLMERADNFVKEEIHFFLHCTSQSGKKGILRSGCILGGSTNLPANAPLASYLGLKGTWFAMSTRELPKRSPYGTQRAMLKVKDMLAYLGKEVVDNDVDGDSAWDAPSRDAPAKGGKKETSGKGKKKRKVNMKQKECYLKGKVPKNEPSQFAMPMLFFECAHYYGNNQYVRLLLVRASDPKLAWCQEFCKELNIHNNPFFQVMHGRLYTYRRMDGQGGGVFVEVLMVGDLQLDQLPVPPQWDEVGTMSRAGFDPRIGLCSS